MVSRLSGDICSDRTSLPAWDCQFRSVGGFAHKTALWRDSLPLGVDDLPHLLHNFEQA